jgi:pilus assembly protein CpaC
MPSGGSMAMAGLIQEQTKQAINGIARRSISCRCSARCSAAATSSTTTTELMVVIVTPYVVRAVAPEGPVATGRRLRTAPADRAVGAARRASIASTALPGAASRTGEKLRAVTYGFITD